MAAKLKMKVEGIYSHSSNMFAVTAASMACGCSASVSTMLNKQKAAGRRFPVVSVKPANRVPGGKASLVIGSSKGGSETGRKVIAPLQPLLESQFKWPAERAGGTQPRLRQKGHVVILSIFC